MKLTGVVPHNAYQIRDQTCGLLCKGHFYLVVTIATVEQMRLTASEPPHDKPTE